jgi:tetratricopeptide (TPR) repeat protein
LSSSRNSQAIQFGITDPALYYYRGVAFYRLGELEQAVENYETAIQLDSTMVKGYNSLCWSYGLLQEPEKALPYCDQAIDLDSDPGTYDSRGISYALTGDFDAAIADFQVYIDYLEEQNDPSKNESLEERKAWVEALTKGINPFTPEVLAGLRED